MAGGWEPNGDFTRDSLGRRVPGRGETTDSDFTHHHYEPGQVPPRPRYSREVGGRDINRPEEVPPPHSSGLAGSVDRNDPRADVPPDHSPEGADIIVQLRHPGIPPYHVLIRVPPAVFRHVYRQADSHGEEWIKDWIASYIRRSIPRRNADPFARETLDDLDDMFTDVTMDRDPQNMRWRVVGHVSDRSMQVIAREANHRLGRSVSILEATREILAGIVHRRMNFEDMFEPDHNAAVSGMMRRAMEESAGIRRKAPSVFDGPDRDVERLTREYAELRDKLRRFEENPISHSQEEQAGVIEDLDRQLTGMRHFHEREMERADERYETLLKRATWLGNRLAEVDPLYREEAESRKRGETDDGA